jgi:uncharacterized repeat protein (TIGR03803 family)
MAVVLCAGTQLTAQPFSILKTFGISGENPIGAPVCAPDGTIYGTTQYGGAADFGAVYRVNSDGSGASNIFSFSGVNGSNPNGGLVLSGTTLYGTTYEGGASGSGTVFALQTDGSGFTNLHDFDYTDGSGPQSSLALSGGVLFGTTEYGGTAQNGTVFSINTDGSGFTSLKSFSVAIYNGLTGYTNWDGQDPIAGLIVSGNMLYGTAYQGGLFGCGTVFMLSMDGTVFSNLYNFTGIDDGRFPYGGLVASGNTLYGTTAQGGTNDDGTVFSMHMAGTGFTGLHDFDGSDGLNPYASMVLSGSTLYGTTLQGGYYGSGTIFQINTDGSGFTNLQDLGYYDTGEYPYGLTVSGGTLFGVADDGGTVGRGAVFELNTDGSGFTAIDDFIQLEGANPYGGLTAGPGNKLYGTLSTGGTANNGVVFEINQDGSGFSQLYDFASEGADGSEPYSSLVSAGDTLYGTTYAGGSSGEGEVFSVNADGSGLTTIYSFQYGQPGVEPTSGLVLSGNTLYGTTSGGGQLDGGTVFKVNTDGSGFAVLHSFAYTDDGAYPQSALVLSGDMLYGTAVQGGFSDVGTVFAINVDGSGFTNLHSFSYSDGGYPYGDLVASGNMLYGTTKEGTATGLGEVFAMSMDGSSFTNLHAFSGPDGSYPYAGLALSGSMLYGTTEGGGSSGYGTIFGLNINGGGFTNIYNFTGGNDGAYPYAGLVVSGGTLYGATALGGAQTEGNVFQVQADGSGFSSLHAFTGGIDGANPYAALLLSNGVLYGTASDGGAGQQGTVFQLNASVGEFTTIHGFNSSSAGSAPYGSLVLSGSMLYGTTSAGGNNDDGTVFAVGTDGSGFITLHTFNGTGDGSIPYDGLLLSGGTLYGTAYGGGTSDYGTIFKINTDGSGFAVLMSFPTTEQNPFTGNYGNTDGASPEGGLAMAGNTLFGTTTAGGGFGYGIVFSLDTNGSSFKVLHNFGSFDGSSPYAGLAVAGSTLYGSTYGGGSFLYGTVFKINTDGSGFTTLHNFGYLDGGAPQAALVVSGSTLFGTTTYGGSLSYGTVFQINLDGTGFTVLHNFAQADGGTLYGSLAISGNALYGVTDLGGPGGAGVVFSIGVSLSGPMLQIAPAGNGVIISWPSPSTGYVLQQNGNLLPSGWSNFTGVTNNNGTTQSVTVSPATGTQFYRLQLQ